MASKKQSDSMKSKMTFESIKSSIEMPKVKHSIEKKGTLRFTLYNTNVSVANAIRRTILTDIPTVVFKPDKEQTTVKILKNTTRFNNEILKQRIGCIPINIKNPEDIEDIIVEINETNVSEALVYITTGNFKIKNEKTDKYLDDETTKKIFPTDKISNGYILFTRLRPKITDEIPGETIHIEAKLSVGTAGEDGMWNVVSTCAYGNTPDQVTQNDEWERIAEQLEKQGVSDNEITYQRQNWYTLQAKRHFIDNSFDFQIETLGVYSNMELIDMACNILVTKLEKIYENCEKENIELNKTATAMGNSVDIKLVGEDYTIGKVLEYILHYEYYLADQQLSYIGFIKRHPHDNYSILRLAFVESNTFTDDNIYALLKFACMNSINIFKNIKEFFL